jgi:hypothetical protein
MGSAARACFVGQRFLLAVRGQGAGVKDLRALHQQNDLSQRLIEVLDQVFDGFDPHG